MEFRSGKPERRPDRRICPRCNVASGARKTCKICRVETKPRLRIVWYVDGKRQRELTGCWREQDADKVLRRKEADYWRQQDLGVNRDVGGTVRDAIMVFSGTKAHLSDDYQRQIRSSLHSFAHGFGWTRSVTAITTDDIARYKTEGLEVLSSTTVRSYMLVLRRFVAYMHEEGWIRRNPAKKVKLPLARKGRDHLRPEEVGPTLQAAWETAPTFAPIATALLLGGWRKAEIVNLRRRDLYLDEGWAYVLDFEGDELTEAWTPKTECSRRAVPLHPLVVRALRRVEPVKRLDGTVSPWVFPVADKRKRKRFPDKRGRMQPVLGDRRSSSTTFFGKRFKPVLDAANISHHVTIHGMRRSFAILLQEAGATDAVIRQALGHSGQGVTELHYLPRRDATVRRWVDAIRVSIPALETPAPARRTFAIVQPRSENGPPQSPSRANRCPHTAPKAGAERLTGQQFA